MAKPNYSFEKRQRELLKKRKKEEKATRKANPGQAEPGDGGNDGDSAADQGPATNADAGSGAADTKPPLP